MEYFTRAPAFGNAFSSTNNVLYINVPCHNEYRSAHAREWVSTDVVADSVFILCGIRNQELGVWDLSFVFLLHFFEVLFYFVQFCFIGFVIAEGLHH